MRRDRTRMDMDAHLSRIPPDCAFRGGAKGETVMAEAIAKLDMAVFVYDYDYNAPNAAHLLKTHEPFFQIIRKAQPDLPVKSSVFSLQLTVFSLVFYKSYKSYGFNVLRE